MSVRGINKGKVNSRFPAYTTYSAGISVNLNADGTWHASADETEHEGILMQDVIAKPSVYYGTVGTLNAGSYQVIVDDIAYVGDKVRVCYGYGEYETSAVTEGVSPAVGGAVYVGTGGLLHTSAQNSGSPIGRYDSTKDSSGKVKVTLFK